MEAHTVSKGRDLQDSRPTPGFLDHFPHQEGKWKGESGGNGGDKQVGHGRRELQ